MKKYILILCVLTTILSCGKSYKYDKIVDADIVAVEDSIQKAKLYINQLQYDASYNNLMQLVNLSENLYFTYDEDEFDDEQLKELFAERVKVDSTLLAINQAIKKYLPLVCISKVHYSDHLLENTDKRCFYASKGDTINVDVAFNTKGTVTLYNANSKQIVRSYGKCLNVTDHFVVPNSSIYMLELNPMGTQYVEANVSLQLQDTDDLLYPKQIKKQKVEATSGDWQAQSVQGVKMQSLFEEPKKFTLRGQLKAAFSGSSRALVALQVPNGATDVMYSLRISTNEGNSNYDGKFPKNMDISYHKVRFMGLPLYESQRSCGLLATILGENQPVREEDAYINMYVFFDALQARKFQDGVPTSKLKYHVDYSTMGTQSCNGRIPSKGYKTIYLGFENERMRYNNYVWLEAVSAIPHVEYFKTKYSVEG
ncbi:MAG: hypothetical protein MJY52_01920 [Bacteroidaceae bacterium]|nr:hypothetical protein [Bacteroidaceae bacterium]